MILQGRGWVSEGQAPASSGGSRAGRVLVVAALVQAVCGYLAVGQAASSGGRLDESRLVGRALEHGSSRTCRILSCGSAAAGSVPGGPLTPVGSGAPFARNRAGYPVRKRTCSSRPLRLVPANLTADGSSARVGGRGTGRGFLCGARRVAQQRADAGLSGRLPIISRLAGLAKTVRGSLSLGLRGVRVKAKVNPFRHRYRISVDVQF